jgi:hypothetical protein
MHALSNLATTPVRKAALTLLVALASTLACAPGGCHRGDGYRAVGCRAAAARKALAFGLSREEALDAIGRSEVVPPWKNDIGLGPTLISNPFDSDTYTSQLGEEYEVVRFFVGATGDSACPFMQGELRLEPLIFVDDKLVGWKWSYLADVLDRRLTAKETTWSFGAFCDNRRSDPPETEATKPATPNADPPVTD